RLSGLALLFAAAQLGLIVVDQGILCLGREVGIQGAGMQQILGALRVAFIHALQRGLGERLTIIALSLFLRRDRKLGAVDRRLHQAERRMEIVGRGAYMV